MLRTSQWHGLVNQEGEAKQEEEVDLIIINKIFINRTICNLNQLNKWALAIKMIKEVKKEVYLQAFVDHFRQ